MGSFGTFLLAYLAFYTFQYIAIPLFPLFQVRELLLTDANISLGTALFYLMTLLTSIALPQITSRLGHKGVLLLGAYLFSIYPLLNAFAQDIGLYLVASILGGITWAFANAGLINRLMERVPEDQLATHMALHNLVLNLGIILGALGSPFLAEALGLREALLVAAGLRLVGAFFLAIWA
jgi:MFS family permease